MDDFSAPREFGKRRPAAPPPPRQPISKRSRHVALLVTGALAVGGSAYAMLPRDNCSSVAPGTPTPGAPQAAACHSGYGGHFGFYSSLDRSTTNSSGASSESISRGGFGSFARAFGFGRGG